LAQVEKAGQGRTLRLCVWGFSNKEYKFYNTETWRTS